MTLRGRASGALLVWDLAREKDPRVRDNNVLA